MTNGELGNQYWAVIEPYWLPLNETWDEGIDEFVAQLHAAPLKVRHLYAAHWCQSEVLNGGFYQFFYNTTGILAPEAAVGFRSIGLQEWSAIVFEAMRYFGDIYPRDRMARLRCLAENSAESANPFDALDERFDGCSDGERHRWARAADVYAASA